MTTIEMGSLLKFFGLCGLILIVLIIAAWKAANLYHKYGERKSRKDEQFMKFYTEIQEHIKNWRVNTANSDDIRVDLRILSKMKGVNKEMVEVLACEFLRKFYEYNSRGEGKLRDDFAVKDLIKN